MNKNWYASLTAALLLMLSAGHVFARQDCVFDSRYLGERQLKSNKQISRYTWNPNALEAKILAKDGGLISAKYWACSHYGAHAVMLMGPYPEVDPDKFGSKFSRLAEIAFNAVEARIVKNYLLKHPISLSNETSQYSIPDSGYSEFFLRYSIVHDSVVLEIKFYRD